MADECIVVDIECFYNDVIKELGIHGGTFSRSFTFKPPYCHDKCTTEEKQVNSFITKMCHLIGWNGGFYKYSQMDDIVQRYIIPGVGYYAKGGKKCEILSKLFKIPFHDLNDLGCPAIELQDLKNNFECESFPSRHRRSLHCAQRKAGVYYNWLIEFHNLFLIIL